MLHLKPIMPSRRSTRKAKKSFLIEDSDEDDFDLTPPNGLLKRKSNNKENISDNTSKKKRASREEKREEKYNDELNLALKLSCSEETSQGDEVHNKLSNTEQRNKDPSYIIECDDSDDSLSENGGDSDFSLSPMPKKKKKTSQKKTKKTGAKMKKFPKLDQINNSESSCLQSQKSCSEPLKPTAVSDGKLLVLHTSASIPPESKKESRTSNKILKPKAKNTTFVSKKLTAQNMPKSEPTRKEKKVIGPPQLTAKWTPPGSASGKSKVSILSPNTSRLRLGLSRNSRVKTLHPNLILNNIKKS